MWTTSIILASAVAIVGLWHLFEHFWNRRLFGISDEGKSFQNIGARHARTLLGQDPNIVAIDVRPPKAFASAHLPGAINTPFVAGKLDTSSLDTTDLNTAVLIYCDGGYRSRKALPQFQELGFRNIYHLHRGILSWKLGGGTCES